MFKRVIYFLVLVTLASFGQESLDLSRGDTPNVLVINSYHTSYRWTENEVNGVISVLGKRGAIQADVYIEYMDSKRFPAGYDLNWRFKDFIVRKYAGVHFSAIVVTDDNALNFMVDYHRDLFPDTPVIACGINRAENKVYTDPPLFHVIRETIDVPGLMAMALALFPATKNVVLLGDGTTTSQLDRAATEEALKQYPGLNVVVLDGGRLSVEDIVTSVEHFHEKSICLFTGFWRDHEGRKTAPEKAIRTAALHMPVFVSSDGYFEPEVVGGVMTSGFKQGQAAGEAVSRVLSGVAVADLVTASGRQLNTAMVNYPVLARYGVTRKELPGEVVFVGKPDSRFLARHWRALLSGGIIIGLLVTLIIVTTRDLFSRVEISKALQKAERDLEATFESIIDGLIVTDADGKVQRVNSAACGLIGWSKDEVIGCDITYVYQTFEVGTRRAASRFFADMVERGRHDDNALEERILAAKNDEEHVIAESVSIIQNSKGDMRGLVVIFRDISEEVQQREERQHAQKMEAIGKLAGGVAHDFNNLLTSIIGNAELLRMSLQDDEEGMECAEHIIKSSSRAADLTGQLLAFSRKGQQVKLKPVNVHDLIDEVISLLGHSIDRRIKVVKKKEAYRHWALGDITQLQNALLNLGINARDAMPEGGTLTFSTRDVVLKEDDSRIVNGQLKPGKYIEIEVADTGSGIDQRLRERIFEPFFTTKAEGKGTGLGLAVVYGIIRTHRGNIGLKSHLGRGTTFTVSLPLCNAPGSEIKPMAAPKFRSIRKGHILVVDDEESIRSLLEKMLKQLGYQVNVCADGLEAVNYYSRHGAEVDLVIMDLMMPRMGGEDAFRRIRTIDPAAKVILISGYTKSKIVEKLLQSGALGFISKPFHVKEFSDEIRKHLG
ncbi:MAG: response regulator [Lentisphaeria bacterium]|nr:response regulator [Lentisphaeria bacterium]